MAERRDAILARYLNNKNNIPGRFRESSDPYEEVWKQWDNRTGTTRTTAEDHDQVVVSWSTFLQQHLLQEPPRMGRGNQLAPPEFRSHRPEWGSIEMLRAMLDILHDGLQIGRDGDDGHDDTTTAAAITTDVRYHPSQAVLD
jgi:hypothetical protein